MMLLPSFDRSLLNVIHLGLGFLILFSADFTITNMQKTINASIHEDKPEYDIDGYVSLCLLYGLYGITLWLAPSFIAVIGYKLSLIIGGASLAIFMFTLALEKVWTAYIGIVLGGIGGSFLWAAEGHYLVLNSDEKTMSRNIGVFWAIYSASMISGNIFAATEFAGKIHIDQETRLRLLLIMGTVALVAVLLFAFLSKPPGQRVPLTEGPVEALRKTWRLFCTKDMMVLLITFVYGGLQQSFGTGVYGPSIGFTREFGIHAKKLVPICGLINGLGDSLGGVSYLIIDRAGIKYTRRHAIIAGLVIQTIAYVSIYINLPNSAVFRETDEKAIIPSQIWLALICSFLIGMGDSCLNTQIFPLLRDLHPEYSAHTSALYKFSKSMSMAVFFFCSSYLGLHLQLIIMFLFGVAGAIGFSYVDIRNSRKTTENISIK
ncbi:UNC93-like protein MFSD11 [Halyomorpha halys]|uniref:UNC93-like protein MFSD11 n=1 Tax=Halyomorpha halys TaxID=286706 RepID=UPI0006D4D15A|nr:UNC93-like protein MFSD11 [Halyomorpha halys]